MGSVIGKRTSHDNRRLQDPVKAFATGKLFDGSQNTLTLKEF